jgi:hypothetical protein
MMMVIAVGWGNIEVGIYEASLIHLSPFWVWDHDRLHHLAFFGVVLSFSYKDFECRHGLTTRCVHEDMLWIDEI